MRLILSLLTTFLIFISSSSYAIPGTPGSIPPGIPAIGIMPGDPNFGSCFQFVPVVPSGIFVWLGGTVPCDNFCGGPAVDSFGQTFSSSLDDLKAVKEDFKDALGDASDELTSSFAPSMSQGFVDETTQVLSGIGALSMKVELALGAQGKTIERTVDNFISSVIETYKNLSVAAIVSENNQDFGDLSQPASGEVGVNMSPVFLEARVKEGQINQKIKETFSDYLMDETGVGAESGVDINISKILSELEKIEENPDFKAANLITKDIIEPALFGDYMKILNMVTSFETFPEDEDSDEKYRLARLIYISKITAIHTAISRTLVNKNPTVDSSFWADKYMAPALASDGSVSSSSITKSLVNDPLSDSAWWGMVATTNNTGLMRAKTYLNATASSLNQERLEVSKIKNNILSISYLSALTEGPI